MSDETTSQPVRVVVGHVQVSEQLLERARRDEEAFRNPPPGWQVPDDWEDRNEPFARSTGHPDGVRIWSLDVSDSLVGSMGDDWSEPVEFRFVRLPDGRLDMLVRKAENPA
jgi:hypothetical protein